MGSRLEVDAKSNALLATDEDRFRRKYQQRAEGLVVTFASPHLEVLELNKFYLLSKSVKKILDQKYYYKPDYLSFKEYGTETLWYLLLFVNDIFSIEEFNKYEVYVPSYGAILELVKKDISEDITVIGEEEVVSQKLLNLYSSKIEPSTGQPEEEEEVAEEEALYWVRQKFEINPGQESNGYIDLGFIPIEHTVTAKIEHGGNWIYNVDYKIIESFDSQMRRLSWREEDCTEGDGLLGDVKEGMMVEVLFAKSQG